MENLEFCTSMATASEMVQAVRYINIHRVSKRVLKFPNVWHIC